MGSVFTHILIEKEAHGTCTHSVLREVELFSVISFSHAHVSLVAATARWAQKGVTVAGGHGRGDGTNQLICPVGLHVDEQETVIVADCGNHRIMEWKRGDTSGRVLAGGNGQGDGPDQSNRPTDVLVDRETNSLIICDYGNRRVTRWSRRSGTQSGETIIDNITCFGLAMDDEGDLYITDDEKHEVRRYRKGETSGTVVAGGHGQGAGLHQLDHPLFVCVDGDHAVYVSDSYNHRVMKWMNGAIEGIVVAGGHGQGKELTQLSRLRGVRVDAAGTVYVADCWNHRVMRWCRGVTQGTVVVGGNGWGEGANQLSYPTGLAFDRQGNLYVADWSNERVQRFAIEKN